MPNTYEVVGTCDPDGTLRPYGSTAPKAPGQRNDPIVVGKKYILASGAHTEGTAQAEATCLAVNGSNALMITHGLYNAAWTSGIQNELDISSYMGGLSVAVNDAYLPRGQGGIVGPTEQTTLNKLSIYNGSSWDDNYSDNIAPILAAYVSSTPTIVVAWTGTSSTSTLAHCVYDSGEIGRAGMAGVGGIVPTFILDLTRVQISGAYISLANHEGQVDAHNVTYGDSNVDTALTELNSKTGKYYQYTETNVTYRQALSALYSLVDWSKVNVATSTVALKSNIFAETGYHYFNTDTGMYKYTTTGWGGGKPSVTLLILSSNPTLQQYSFSDGSTTNWTDDTATNIDVRLYYTE